MRVETLSLRRSEKFPHVTAGASIPLRSRSIPPPLMANSGSHRNDDPERARCVRSDVARKRATSRYKQWGQTPPPSLLPRETKEYDRVRGRLFSGNSFEASSSCSCSSLRPVKRELEELSLVKMEPEAEAVPERRAGAVFGPEDFLPPAEADSLLPVLLARSAREAEEDQQRRRREEEIDAMLYEQGVASALAFGHKMEEWRREVTVQERIYIELSSDDDYA
ncbi:putative ATP-dependent helicase C23E6.02 [Hordeum vulgare]|nr:putative ATP-dependent helicase C23E6.02 [Hordeum vulgare]